MLTFKLQSNFGMRHLFLWNVCVFPSFLDVFGSASKLYFVCGIAIFII